MDYTESEPQSSAELSGRGLLPQVLHKRRLVISLTLEPEGMSSVVLSVESLLTDAGHVQRQCRECREQLERRSAELRSEAEALREQSQDAQMNMVWIRQQLQELLQTKAAFEARERQAQKLSRQL